MCSLVLVPCEDPGQPATSQEADTHQTRNLLVPWFWASQLPELGEISVSCVKTAQFIAAPTAKKPLNVALPMVLTWTSSLSQSLHLSDLPSMTSPAFLIQWFPSPFPLLQSRHYFLDSYFHESAQIPDSAYPKEFLPLLSTPVSPYSFAVSDARHSRSWNENLKMLSSPPRLRYCRPICCYCCWSDTAPCHLKPLLPQSVMLPFSVSEHPFFYPR